MNLFVLSECNPENTHVGWLVSKSLEDVLARVLNTTFLYPIEDETEGFLHQRKKRFLKNWFRLDQMPTLGKGPNVLLIIGLTPHFLLSMHSLKGWLRQFDVRIGYLLDGFDPAHIDREVAPYLDHLFVIMSEITDEIQKTRGINTHFLPVAIDTFDVELSRQHRWIDILGCGRKHEQLHQQLVKHTHRPNSNLFYHYSTFAHPDLLDRDEHRQLQAKLLSHAQLNLCFEGSDISRFQGHSPLLYRWFESWLYGCNPVGKRPFGEGVAELMDWENSAIDLPEDEADWLVFLEDTLTDQETLATNAQRNYEECLLRHDWRYRIQTLLNVVGLPIPELLSADISALQEKANSFRVKPSVHVNGGSPIIAR
jgi:Glycosyl transferases group 1